MKHVKKLFEYATIRAVPNVEREEFLNIGVILLCATDGFLENTAEINEQALRALNSSVDLEDLHTHIAAFKKICAGETSGGPIAKLSLAERFRWLTAARSTILQTSHVHPGLCDDPAETLQRLHQQLVKRM